MAHLAWSILFLTLLFTGCAGPPQQELASARAALAQAYAADAARLVPEAYAAAAHSLRQGEELVGSGDYTEARRLLPLAASQARHAETLAAAEKEQNARRKAEQRRAAEERARQIASRPPPQPAPPEPAPEPKTEKSRKAAPEPRPAPPPPARPNYRVGEGETLWSIAADPKVYNDPLLWPVLYQANRDQIKDPRQIYPGQTLKIPRDLTSAEKEEARDKARASDIFPARELLPETSPTRN
jgi:nucleoid-associated protein YgaU